jgi:ATP-dependent exoDNAse (exonuclease V) beta subunit
MSLTVYKSSAGSGKTYTLVLEYLALVIANPDSYRNILAITFTNKAANEMKSRIVEALTQIVYPSDREALAIEDLIGKIAEKTGLDKTQISLRAKRSLANILHGYSNFAVSTIDSFVHGLVRNFARELKLPVNFDVEVDQDKLINKTIDLLLSKVGVDGQITHILAKFIAEKMDDEKSWNIERELRDFAGILLKESSMEPIGQLRNLQLNDFKVISNKISENLSLLKQQMMKPAIKAIDFFAQHSIEPQHLFQGKNGAFSYFNRIAGGDFSKYNPNTHVVKLLNEQNWTSQKCPADIQNIIESNKQELHNLLEHQVALMEEKMKTYLLLQLIRQNIYSTALLNEFENVMEEFRNNENIVHISEFNKRIAKVLNDNPIPFIYERIGEKYKNLLVDEFQDTSTLQWHNLLPLMENSLATDQFNMIVGDGKQAIYRWRSGEVEQFAALPQLKGLPANPLMQQRQQLFQSHYVEKSLDKNYRSAQEIVAFNNKFFDFAAQNISGDLKKIYDGQKQQFREDKSGGRVHIEFITKDGLSGDDLEAKELERILEIVGEQAKEFNLSEIAILTRSNANASAVARCLLENGTNVVTDEALRLSASSDVNFIVDILRFISQPDNKPVIAAIITYLLENSQNGLEKLHHYFENTLEINPKNTEAIPVEKMINTHFGFDFSSLELQALPLYEMIDRIIKTFGLDYGKSNPFVTFFRDLVLKFTAGNIATTANFLEFWDESGYKSSIVIPDEAEAVKVMTIHKAKGLQFPVVIFPFANRKPDLAVKDAWIAPSLESIPQLRAALVRNGKKLQETNFAPVYETEVQKSFLDNLNVLYVAMTRPSERLFVLLHDKHNADGEWKASGIFPDNADLLSQYLQHEGLWQKEQSVYLFGSSDHRQQSKKKTSTQSHPSPKHKTVFDFREHLSLRFSAPESRLQENKNDNRHEGIMVHDLLSAVRSKSEIPFALHQAVNNGLIEDREVKKYADYLEKVLTHPELGFLFDTTKKIYNEKEILLSNGKTLRPDRIVSDSRSTWLADYKTGKPAQHHRSQLNKYAEGLMEAGYGEISKCLIYLDIENFEEIKFEKWD